MGLTLNLHIAGRWSEWVLLDFVIQVSKLSCFRCDRSMGVLLKDKATVDNKGEKT